MFEHKIKIKIKNVDLSDPINSLAFDLDKLSTTKNLLMFYNGIVQTFKKKTGQVYLY